jgi:farnesyl-diphosphate farnesyltransferase
MLNVMQNKNLSESINYCVYILPYVSRTFAMGIQVLSGVVHRAVLVGYLLCRIVDTIEDDLKLPAEKKAFYIDLFMECFKSSKNIKDFSSCFAVLTGNQHHIDLVKNTEHVFSVFFSLSEKDRSNLKKWVFEMSFGMKEFVLKYPGGLRIKTMEEYKKYCYYVAGTVGCFLTQLWQDHMYFLSSRRRALLKENAVLFGEALQSVNIIKDIIWDFKKENAIYLPEETILKYGGRQEDLLNPDCAESAQRAVGDLIDMTKLNLEKSLNYILNIPWWHCRIRFFSILPLFLAFATLKKINDYRDRFLQLPTPIKITREDVKKIYFQTIFSSFYNKYFERTARSYQF